jgi:hypothetical protein
MRAPEETDPPHIGVREVAVVNGDAVSLSSIYRTNIHIQMYFNI